LVDCSAGSLSPDDQDSLCRWRARAEILQHRIIRQLLTMQLPFAGPASEQMILLATSRSERERDQASAASVPTLDRVPFEPSLRGMPNKR
jgi:hypothetical protein